MIRALTLLLTLSLVTSACSQGGSEDGAGNSGAVGKAGAATSSKAEAAAPKPVQETVHVRLETEAGPITLALDAKNAPATTKNFLRYVDAGRFDGMDFYRAARTKGNEKEGFIQGGIRRNYRLMYAPIEHEPTSKTGLRHEAGTISMARSKTHDIGGMGDFFIITKAMPELDAGPGNRGYAAFGKVVGGMDTVRRILASPTSPGGSEALKGQMIEKPVRIEKVVRID